MLSFKIRNESRSVAQIIGVSFKDAIKNFNQTLKHFHFRIMKDFWREFVLPVFICLTIVKLSSALLEPSPYPATLRECYNFRSYNMTPSDEIALQIQNYCYKQYQFKQIAEGKVFSTPNITEEGMNYINSLFRQLFGESSEIVKNEKLKRQKRQTMPVRIRREVRSPGAFAPFARCIRSLYNRVNWLFSFLSYNF